MIDAATETLLTLAQAAAELPRRRQGRKTHVSTLYRWTVSGCRGVVLESIQIGATRCTSREALNRFFDRLTNSGGTGEGAPTQRSVTQRQRQTEAAEKKLKDLGV